MVKAVKDPSVQRDDFYKSGTIHTNQGEPANSRSRPTPKRKPQPGKPITQGKLLRPGGPRGAASKLASRPAATKPVRPQPAQSGPAATQSSSSLRSVPQSSASRPQALPQSTVAVNGASHKRNDSGSRAPPPPPPPAAPPAHKKGTYKVLYDYGSRGEGELSLQKDDRVEVAQIIDNGKLRHPSSTLGYWLMFVISGWCLVKKSDDSTPGWAPFSYLAEEEPKPTPPPAPPAAHIRAVPPPPPSSNMDGIDGTARAISKPAAKAKPAPPAPPKRPGVGVKKPAPPPTPRDSAVSMGTSGGGDSGRSTPNGTKDSKGGSLAGQIAAALKQQEADKRRKENGEW